MFGLLRKHQKIALLVAILFALLLLSLIAYLVVTTQNKIKEGRYIGQEIESQNTISVSGLGEVYTKPDLALVTFAVTTEAKTVEEAMSENTEKMNDIISAIKEEEVEEKYLKTTNFSIYPRYEWREPSEEGYYPEGQRVLVGYEINQSLEIRIKDLEKVQKIIQAATREGANQMSNLQFTVEDREEVEKQARQEAIEEAQQKARELADQLGVRLVRIANFYEYSDSGIRYAKGVSIEESAALGIGGGEAPAPQIQTGENKIQVEVTITYEIN